MMLESTGVNWSLARFAAVPVTTAVAVPALVAPTVPVTFKVAALVPGSPPAAELPTFRFTSTVQDGSGEVLPAAPSNAGQWLFAMVNSLAPV